MKKPKKVSDDTTEQGISQAHDQFFRTVMQDKRVEGALFKVHLLAGFCFARKAKITRKIISPARVV
jgi:hypothetical protein